jgi:drug/metabolite transporter (DMT)-like permease
MRRSREALGRQMDTPWYYDAAYALAAGGIVAAQGLPTGVSTLAVGLCCVLLAGYYQAWTRRTGVKVLGHQPRRARWVAIGFGLVVLVLALAAMWGKRHMDAWWPAAAGGLLAAALAPLFSSLWMRAYRVDLREGE